MRLELPVGGGVEPGPVGEDLLGLEVELPLEQVADLVGHVVPISSRMARPKRRRRSSSSTASSRSSASSSSRARSALRVTRNGQPPTTSMPGNSWSRWAAMTCSTGTNRSLSGRAISRGTDGGTLRRANRWPPPSGSATRTAEVQRLVGDVGERVAGIEGLRGQDGEDVALELAGERLRSAGPSSLPVASGGCPRLGQGRDEVVEQDPVEALDLGVDLVRMAASWASGLSPSGGAEVTPPATWSLRPATRTMKNSSRLEA